MNSPIAFIGPLPPPLGGVAVANKNLQDFFEKRGIRHIFFDTSKKKLTEDLYTNKSIGDYLIGLKIIVNFFQFILKEEFKYVNIYVTSNKAFFRDAILIIILRTFNKYIIVHFHSKKKGEYFLEKKRVVLLAWILNKCNKIVLLSEDHKKYFSKWMKNDKIIILENFVDHDKFECEIRDKVDEFLYVGRLSKQKGVWDLLKAIELLKKNYELKFNIVGLAESDKKYCEILKYIEDNKLSVNIVMHGLKDGVEKYELYKRCKWFVFPSHFENSPVVIKEAIASNQALICSDIEANLNILNIGYIFCYLKIKKLNC